MNDDSEVKNLENFLSYVFWEMSKNPKFSNEYLQRTIWQAASEQEFQDVDRWF